MMKFFLFLILVLVGTALGPLFPIVAVAQDSGGGGGGTSSSSSSNSTSDDPAIEMGTFTQPANDEEPENEPNSFTHPSPTKSSPTSSVGVPPDSPKKTKKRKLSDGYSNPGVPPQDSATDETPATQTKKKTSAKKSNHSDVSDMGPLGPPSPEDTDTTAEKTEDSGGTAPLDNETEPTKTKVSTKKKPAHKNPALWQLGPRFLTWQEKVAAREGITETRYNSRFMAAALNLSYRAKMGKGPRWFYHHSLDLFMGQVNASGGPTNKELDATTTMGFQVSPGIALRTANDTLFGFTLPLFFREVNWKTGSPNINLGDKSVVAFGLGMTGSWRLSSGNFLTTAVTFRQSSVLWTLGIDFKFPTLR